MQTAEYAMVGGIGEAFRRHIRQVGAPHKAPSGPGHGSDNKPRCHQTPPQEILELASTPRTRSVFDPVDGTGSRMFNGTPSWPGRGRLWERLGVFDPVDGTGSRMFNGTPSWPVRGRLWKSLGMRNSLRSSCATTVEQCLAGGAYVSECVLPTSVGLGA
jgi:hypothetical protein